MSALIFMVSLTYFVCDISYISGAIAAVATFYYLREYGL